MFLRKPAGVENGETFEIVLEKGKIVGVHGMRPCQGNIISIRQLEAACIRADVLFLHF
jgi:hypothetical protein